MSRTFKYIGCIDEIPCAMQSFRSGPDRQKRLAGAIRPDNYPYQTILHTLEPIAVDQTAPIFNIIIIFDTVLRQRGNLEHEKQNAAAPDCKLLSDNINYELTRINEWLAPNKL